MKPSCGEVFPFWIWQHLIYFSCGQITTVYYTDLDSSAGITKAKHTCAVCIAITWAHIAITWFEVEVYFNDNDQHLGCPQKSKTEGICIWRLMMSARVHPLKMSNQPAITLGPISSSIFESSVLKEIMLSSHVFSASQRKLKLRGTQPVCQTWSRTSRGSTHPYRSRYAHCVSKHGSATFSFLEDPSYARFYLWSIVSKYHHVSSNDTE